MRLPVIFNRVPDLPTLTMMQLRLAALAPRLASSARRCQSAVASFQRLPIARSASLPR
jgi:hypothetical protein